MPESKSYSNFMGVFYPDSTSYDCDSKLELVRAIFPEWVIAFHDKDVYTPEDERKNPEHKAGSFKKPHYHWLVRFDSNHKKTISSVANMLEIPAHDVQLPRLPWRGEVRYLLHLDSKEKYHYDVSILEANFDFTKYIQILDETAKVQMILNFIFESKCTSVIGLTQWCVSNNCWDAYRRAASIFHGVLHEMKDIE